MTLRPCIAKLPDGRTCGRLTPHSRCEYHERLKAQGHRRAYLGDWRKLSRAAIAAEPWCHCTRDCNWHRGGECRSPYDLTTDHRVPVVHGGASTLDNINVLCRRCNGAKGGR